MGPAASLVATCWRPAFTPAFKEEERWTISTSTQVVGTAGQGWCWLILWDFWREPSDRSWGERVQERISVRPTPTPSAVAILPEGRAWYGQLQARCSWLQPSSVQLPALDIRGP